MADLHGFHADHGASFESVAGREVVAAYRNPERTHRAVRNAAGVTEHPVGVIVVEGGDRLEYVDNVITNDVPTAEGEGCYAFLLDPQGRITTDLHVFNAGERLLLFTPPGRATPTADGWETFIQDVDITVATPEFAVFGVYGPSATETVASVLAGAAAPDDTLGFVRGSIDDVGVTVVRDEGLTGEEGYLVISTAEEAVDVLDDLVNRGPAAVPFGRRTWGALTLEAGTPLFDPDLEGRIPNAAGLRTAVDFDKGCYVGQEVVSRIENRGTPPDRLIGLRLASLPDGGAAVMSGDDAIGEVTRAVQSPVLETPIAFAYVDFGHEGGLAVRVDGTDVPAERVELPFVETGHPSGRLPRYA